MSDSDSDSTPSSPVLAPTPAAAAPAVAPSSSKAAAGPASKEKKKANVAKKKQKSGAGRKAELSFITGTHRMIDNRATHPELRRITISSSGNALVSAFATTLLKRILGEHQRLALHGNGKATMTPFTIQRCLSVKMPFYAKLDQCQAFSQQRLDQFTRSLTPVSAN